MYMSEKGNGFERGPILESCVKQLIFFLYLAIWALKKPPKIYFNTIMIDLKTCEHYFIYACFTRGLGGGRLLVY